MQKEIKVRFPKNFLWGCATASYQVEGAAKADGKGASIWDKFSHIPGKTYRGNTGDVACDHYHRYASDVKLMSDLGLKAYRFSIAWPRILPQGKGKINQKGLDFYDRLVDELLKANIIPFVTLYHWDLPQALEDKGGWRVKDTSYAFGEYAKIVARSLSDRVTNWMTLNELPCSAFLGYRDGIHAPGAKEPPAVVNQVVHNLLLAHGLAVQAIRKNAKNKPEIGMAHCADVKIPYKNTKPDIGAARRAWWEMNEGWNTNSWLLEPMFKGKYPADIWKLQGKAAPEITDKEMKIISSPLDFLGLNVYTGWPVKYDRIKGFKNVSFPKNYPKTEMGWDIVPESIYYALVCVNEKYNIKKFYITENGCAFKDAVSPDGRVHDVKRTEFLGKYLTEVNKAIKDGVNVRGYFQWSLMDNYEWARGYSKRFGIVYVDYPTQKRIIKDSGFWYKEVIKNNGF